MSKARSKPEWKKALAILAVIVFVMTPLGERVYMSASHWAANKIFKSLTQSFPKVPGATPSISAKSAK